MTNGSDRLDRIESVLELIVEIQERGISLQGQQQEQIQVLINLSIDHAAMLQRLDAIIERMVYREGRNGDDPPQP